MKSYFDEGEEFDDKRKERRWNLPIPVRVKGTLRDGAAFEEESITTEVGPFGMCVLISKDVHVNDTLVIVAPEERFESPAKVVSVHAVGANKHRIRVHFTPPATFKREAAAKKYIYDLEENNWVGYMEAETYYNSKLEPFGRIQGTTIVRMDSDQVERVYDTRGNCIGHIM